jgi:hypothetical protein
VFYFAAQTILLVLLFSAARRQSDSSQRVPTRQSIATAVGVFVLYLWNRFFQYRNKAVDVSEARVRHSKPLCGSHVLNHFVYSTDLTNVLQLANVFWLLLQQQDATTVAKEQSNEGSLALSWASWSALLTAGAHCLYIYYAIHALRQDRNFDVVHYRWTTRVYRLVLFSDFSSCLAGIYAFAYGTTVVEANPKSILLQIVLPIFFICKAVYAGARTRKTHFTNGDEARPVLNRPELADAQDTGKPQLEDPLLQAPGPTAT